MHKEIQEGLEEYELQKLGDEFYVCSFCGAIVHEDDIVSNGMGLYACPPHSNHPLMQNDHYYYEGGD